MIKLIVRKPFVKSTGSVLYLQKRECRWKETTKNKTDELYTVSASETYWSLKNNSMII